METRQIKLAICGPGKCGKDTAAIWLRDNTTLRYRHSTSYAALPYVFGYLYKRDIRYPNHEECYLDRHNHRGLWAEAIDNMNSIDQAFLYKLHANDQDILTGVRRKREIDACRKAGLFNLAIWIEWIPAQESGTVLPVDHTQEYGPEECEMIIKNYQGYPEAMTLHLSVLSDTLGITKNANRCTV